MPAYRSSAEADIREAVVARIREQRPNARIIHEINVSTYGPNRIDVLAVDVCEIIAVEIKSAKDKLDRLPAQAKAMRACAHHTVAAIHEKFLVETKTNQWSAHYSRDGDFYRKTEPKVDTGYVWVFPEIRRVTDPDGYDDMSKWRFPKARMESALPQGALELLWRDELYELCSLLKVSATRRSTMGDMSSALRWYCTGRELTTHVCAALRRRECAEADAPIFEKVAA